MNKLRPSPYRSAFLLVATLTALAATAFAEVGVPYHVPQDSRVSLALYNRDGQLVRTLLTGKPHAKGDYAASWDGRDRYGDALPAEEYNWKLLATDGLRAEFITQVGQNPNPNWEKSVGNHQPPTSAAVDATGVYRQGCVNEGAHWGVKTDLEGRYLWVNDDHSRREVGGEALTLVNDRLFELTSIGTVHGVDAKSGEIFTGTRSEPKPWNLKLKDARPGDMCGDQDHGLLVAAYPGQNTVQWFSAQDGALVDTATGITNPVAVAVAREGTVLVLSEGAVVKLTREHKEPQIVIAADKLQSPWRLCVSPKSGEIFVAENSLLAKGSVIRSQPNFSEGNAPDMAALSTIKPGHQPRHHQVKRFSADGLFLHAYGSPEGRKDGPYIPTDFKGLTDIEADMEGGFVVTEGNHTPPRRSARFNAQGKLLREWIGAQHYGIIVCPEPNDPQHVWFTCNADQPALVRCEVDYEKRSWRVVEIYQDVFTENPFARVPAIPTLFAHGGRMYIQGGGVQPGGLTLSIYDPARKQLRPCNASGSRNKRNYLWNDLNDDGLASDSEVEWLSRNQLGGYVNPEDLLLVTTVHATGYQAGNQLAPDRLTAGGTPVYVSTQLRKQQPWVENGKKNFPYDCRRGPDGNWYACFADSFSNPNEGAENHGVWYYNSCSAIDRLVKWDRNWKPLWSVGRHSSDDDHETGSTAMPRGLVGFTHGCVVLGDASDEEAARPIVWTEDGLYVDELLRVPTDTLRKEEYGEENTNEYPTGHLATDPKTGETYYYALNSTGGSPIYRISGWNGWHRASGRVRLDAAETRVAKRDGTGLKGEYFNTPDCSGEPVLTRTDPLVFFYWFAGKDGWPKGIDPNNFSCRWTGQVEAATTETYRFVWESYAPWRGEGWGTPGRHRWLRLWVGGNLILDTGAGLYRETTFGLPQPQGIYAELPLKAGERYDLRLEAGFATNAVARLCWETPGLDRRAILPEFLHPEPGPKRKLETSPEKRPEVLADFGFEETTGVLSRSRAGGDVFGRLTGNTRRVPGKFGRALEFNAKGEYDTALFPIDEELGLPDTDYAVAFWFKTTAPEVRLCEARRYSSYNNRWGDHVVSLAGGKVRFALQGDNPLETPGTFNDGQWHHVVTTVGEGGQRLHVGGKLIATGKLVKRTRTSNRLGLDLGPGSGPGLVGMDEVKIFGRSLTNVEITGLSK